MAERPGLLARLTPVGVVERTAVARAAAEDAFVVAGSYRVRLEWDPFVHEQHLVGTDTPGKGVRTVTRSRHGLSMTTEYLTYRPPTHMGMKMIDGPRLFRTFSGSWHFKDLDDGRCEVVYRYRYHCRPAWLGPISHRIGNWYLGRDIERRVAAFVAGIEDADIVARARQEAVERTGPTERSAAEETTAATDDATVADGRAPTVIDLADVAAEPLSQPAEPPAG